MKNSLLKLIIASLITFSFEAIAQPSLTNASNSPVVGDKFNWRNSSYVSPGSAGASQIWNLSAMSTASAVTNYTAVTAASTPSGSAYPSANVSVTDGTSYLYYATSAASWLNYGTVAGGVVFSYSNPETYLNYTFNYTNTFTDAWACTFTSGITFSRTGTSTVTADGWGTVTTPAGTFNNVMRIHLLQVYKDSSSSFPTINYVNDEYLWYRPGTHYPIVSVFSFTTGASSVSTGGGYLINVVTGLNENSSLVRSINVFPNPASQNLNVNCNLETNNSCKLIIYDGTGQMVKHISELETVVGENKFKLNISDLASGIYYLQISLEGVLVKNERFVITN
ncbi:MAG TPA: T9SS type A sorting domain-containing protein [Bacteroidia bacterium]|jgi:hypothetical protein|nr:T9SS type A sorting domain-containing protein [Bacteroidia bacterium]